MTYSALNVQNEGALPIGNIGANYRPEAIPVTFFAGYRYDQLEASASGFSVAEGNSSTIFTGLRLSFGSDSLKEEERSGPVWAASTLLP